MDESQEQTAESWGSKKKKKIRTEMKIKCSVKVLHMKKKKNSLNYKSAIFKS